MAVVDMGVEDRQFCAMGGSCEEGQAGENQEFHTHRVRTGVVSDIGSLTCIASAEGRADKICTISFSFVVFLSIIRQ